MQARRILFVLLLVSAATVSCKKNTDSVAVLVSKADSTVLLQLQDNVPFSNTVKGEIISVDMNDKRQQMEGVGAALTWSSAYVLKNNLNSADRQKLFTELFTPEGIGISYIRLTIGSSDFSPGNHSYSESPDTSLQNFSIDMDLNEVVPILKEILAVNPTIKIMASPWSPPAWMKTTKSMVGGSLLPEYYGVYANYLIRYIKAMQGLGITIDAITVQNEPEYGEATYPCMLMRAEEQKVFIRDYLGPRMTQDGISTKIILFDHNCDSPQYPISIMNDSIAKGYVAGAGFHLYKGDIGALCQVHEAHPDKDLYFTEQSGGGWAPKFNDNILWYTGTLIVGATRCWSRNVLLWNLALDENDGPKNNGCSNCWGVVQVSSKGDVRRNAEYYALGHYGKFVQDGAIRLGSTQQPVQNVAFLNPDGTKVLLAVNPSNADKDVTVDCDGRMFSFSLAGRSAATFYWK